MFAKLQLRSDQPYEQDISLITFFLYFLLFLTSRYDEYEHERCFAIYAYIQIIIIDKKI